MNHQPSFILRNGVIYDSHTAILTEQQLKSDQCAIIRHLKASGVLTFVLFSTFQFTNHVFV